MHSNGTEASQWSLEHSDALQRGQLAPGPGGVGGWGAGVGGAGAGLGGGAGGAGATAEQNPKNFSPTALSEPKGLNRLEDQVSKGTGV